MASGTTGAPHNIPFPVGADTYALTSDLQGMASQIAARLGTVDAFAHPRLAQGTDFNTVLTPGTYPVVYTDHPNQPFAAGGYLLVESNGEQRRMQTFKTNEVTPRYAERVTAITGFNPWQYPREVASWVKPILAAGTDFNTVTVPGQYPFPTGAFPNQPFNVGGYLEVLDNGFGRRLQRVSTNEPIPRHAERVTAITGFNPWQYTRAEAQGAYEHMTRESDMQRRRRNRVTTPGAVVLIFDHGLTNFKATIWPLLEARGLPVTLAMNPGRMLSHDTNNGASYDDVKAWAATGLVEPANHSYNHVDSTDYAQEIRDSRIELEAQLGQAIDTWVMPSNSYGDFEINSDPDQYWSTDAGRMILASHGAVTGIVADQTLPIGGNQIGVGGTWIDTAGRTATMRTDITNAINAGGMKIVRNHPEYLNVTGYIDTAELTEFLDWLVQRRDAGDLTVLTFRDAMSASHEPAAATWDAAITALNAAAT